MNRTDTVADILGQHMLKGWILTDKRCPTPGCSVPLMRSPQRQTPVVSFCANCDGGPANSVLSTSTSATSMQSPPSRASTPPTELSIRSESPEFVLPLETEETRLRRAQSDRASSEIGKLLLQGWAMLAEECPNSACYGVPLVRAPKAGGEIDDKKKCVICLNTFVSQTDSQGREGYVIVDGPAKATQAQARDVAPPPTTAAVPKPEETLAPVPTPTLVSTTSTIPVLEESNVALQNALRALNVRLGALSNPAALDPTSIGATAEAISKLSQALSEVRALQWSEHQAGQSSDRST